MVVTPAGYDFTPCTPARFASAMVAAVMLGCRYSDMRKVTSGASACKRAR